jgi:predicted XRE-type DNA-binding protein
MKNKIIEGSGNVFADLNLPNSEECLKKSDIVYQIAKAIKDRHLTQEEAAKLLGIDQPKVSALLNGRFYSFSLSRLLRFLDLLGKQIKYSFEDKDCNPKSPPLGTLSTKPKRKTASCI